MDKSLELRLTGDADGLANAQRVLEVLSRPLRYCIEIREQKPPESQNQQPAQYSSIVTLDDLEIEPLSPRDASDNNKILYTFDKSLTALRQRGYQRHPSLAEAFRILIDAIENPNSQYKSISDDMRSSYGEWFSLAMQRTSETDLEFYLDPENLVLDDPKYVIKGKQLDCSEIKTFTINKDIPSKRWIDLNQFPNNLVEFLYSRKYDELPDIMKSGDRKTQLWLPEQGIIRPCGRGGGFGSFRVDADCDGRASRGVSLRTP